MFQRWRLRLREAEEAFAQGRLEEARSLLAEENLQAYLPAKRLTSLVAQRIADRGRRQVIAGDTSAGWRDMEVAREMAGDTDELLSTRQELIDHFLSLAERHIGHRETAAAISCLERLENHQVRNQKALQLKDIARRLESSRKLCRRGRFADAQEQIRSAKDLRSDWNLLSQWESECGEQGAICSSLTEKLHRHMSAEEWSDVLQVANELIELAPEYRLARDARKRAWTHVGARVADSQRSSETQYWVPRKDSRALGKASKGETKGDFNEGVDSCTGAKDSKQRFQLWVDAVGGFLVCLQDAVTLGQATPGNRVDIPIQGDLSSLHATIRRRGEGYLIDPHQKVSIQGNRIHDTALLKDGDEIELGNGIRLRYRQPHALSATARLDFVSRHRTKPTSDAILLMAESCVLGPQWHDHIICRDWAQDVVLFRQDDQLNCRAMDSFEIDGCLCDGRGPIGLNSHINGDDFSMSLERIS